MVKANCEVGPTNALETHLAVHIIQVFNFRNFSMHVKVFVCWLVCWYPNDWIVNFELFKILSRPCSQVIYNGNFRIFVEWVFKIRCCLRLIYLLFFLWGGLLADWNHFRRWRLFIPIKYDPVRLLPNVAVKLLISIDCGNVYFCYTDDIANLNNMGELTDLIGEELNWSKSSCRVTSQSSGLKV